MGADNLRLLSRCGPAGCLAGFGIYKYVDYKMVHGKNTYIAVLGTDEREGQTENQRSDVLMLAHVSFTDSTVNLISLPPGLLCLTALRGQ